MATQNSIIQYLLDDIADDFLMRTRRGETPSIAEYQAKYPDLASEIGDFLETLAAVALANPEDNETLVGISAKSTQLPSLPEGQIGPYRLGRVLGAGGMGTVYLAEQSEPFLRKVALKLIRPGMHSSKIIDRFEVERQAVAMMDHSNIAKILDAGTTQQGLPYFVMELVDGIPVTKFCDQNQLGIDQRLSLFLSICDAIQHAHQKGIIHRDIKPANILVGWKENQPVAKVIDFGLAKALDKSKRLSEKSQLTELGNIVGTLEYMSPEQTSFNSDDVDTRTDIYSLGVLLYELLVGVTPLAHEKNQDSSPLKLLDKIQHEPPAKPSDRLSSSTGTLSEVAADRKIQSTRLRHILQGDLDWIVMKSLEKERDRRYETVAAFAKDIQRFLEGKLVEARPPSASYKIKKFVGRNRGLVTALSLITTILFCGVIGTSYGFWKATKSAENERIAKDEAIAKGILAAKSADEAKHSASQARIAEKRANESLQIFTDSIFAASPYRGAVADTRASEILRFAKDRLAQSDLDQEGREQFLVVLSRAFSHLAQPDAVSTTRELYNLRKSKYGKADQRTLRAKIDLVSAHSARQDFDRAKEIHQELIEEIPKELSPTDSLNLDANRALAAILYAKELKLAKRGNDLKTAIKILEETYEVAKTNDGIKPLLKAYIQRDLGLAYSTPELPPAGKCQSEKGIPLLLESVKYFESEFGKESTEYYTTKDKLGIAYLQSGDYPTAQDVFRETLAALEKKFGKDHINTLPTLLNLSSALWWSGFANPEHRTECLKLQERGIKRMIQELGPESDSTLSAMINSGTCYWSIKKYDKSIELFSKVVQAHQNRFGKNHQETRVWNEVLGKNYYESKQYEKAIPILQDQYTWELASDHDASHLEVILRDSFLKAGKAKEHLKMAQARLAKIRKEHGSQSSKLGQILTQMGHHTYLLKDYENAESMLTEAYAIRSQLIPGSWQLAGLKIFLGLNYKGQEKFELAKAELTAGYQGIKKNLAMVHPLVKLQRQIEPLEALIEIAKWEKNGDDEQKWTKELKLVTGRP